MTCSSHYSVKEQNVRKMLLSVTVKYGNDRIEETENTSSLVSSDHKSL